MSKEDKYNYRPCVRVIPVRGNKVYLGKRVFEGKLDYAFPGGGIEEGMSAIQAVIEESREELGILVKNPVHLGIDFKYLRDKPFTRGTEVYHGGVDSWYVAEYVKDDKRVYNIEGDGMEILLVSFDVARKLILSTDNESIYDFRGIKIKALELAKSRFESSNRNALESW